MASTETYKTPYGEIVEQESSDEEEDGIPYQEKLHSSIYLCRMTSRGELLWSKPIDGVGHKNAALQAEASKDLKRSLLQLPCHKYRSLLPSPLPAVDGGGPSNIRDGAWLRRTMRAILVRAVDVEKASSNSADPSSANTICFPILAYRFFDGSDRSSDATRLVEGLSLCSDPNQGERDDDRWGLYHGVRKMMADDDDAEASLFFELLDESNGQDVLAFILQVLVEVDVVMKESLLSSSSNCTNPDPVLLPLPLALELTSKFFASGRVCTESHGLQPADLTALTKKTVDLATEGSGENGAAIALYVDMFQWLVLVPAREYCREVSRRKSLARLLFETASTGTLSSYDGSKSNDNSEGGGINFPQFESVMQVMWRGISQNEIDELYSLAYDFQRTVDKCKSDGFDGISLEAFLHVADKRRFFARSRR